MHKKLTLLVFCTVFASWLAADLPELRTGFWFAASVSRYRLRRRPSIAVHRCLSDEV